VEVYSVKAVLKRNSKLVGVTMTSQPSYPEHRKEKGNLEVLTSFQLQTIHQK